MKKLIVAALVVVAVGGAIYHFHAGPPAIKQLLAMPDGPHDLGYADIEVINPGCELSDSCEPGRITLFAFVSESCPGCIKTRDCIEKLTDCRADVAIRYIDLGANWSGRDYEALYGQEIYSIPHVAIYNGSGDLLVADDGRDKAGLKLLCKWMNAELNRPRNRRYARAG